jgi:hypothetical protein
MAQPAPQAPPPSPLYPPAPPYAAPPPPKKSRTALYAVVAVVVVIVVVLIALAASGAFSPKAPASNNSPPPPPPPPVIVTVVTSGTVWNLNARYYEGVGPIDLTSNSSWTISGSFTATNNGITAYVMNSSQYSAWGGSGSPSAYYWTSGPSVTSGSVNTILPSGTYYFVWDNTNFITSTSVQITSNVIATSSG